MTQSLTTAIRLLLSTIRMSLRPLFVFVERVSHSIYSGYMALHSFLMFAALDNTYTFNDNVFVFVELVPPSI